MLTTNQRRMYYGGSFVPFYEDNLFFSLLLQISITVWNGY